MVTDSSLSLRAMKRAYFAIFAIVPLVALPAYLSLWGMASLGGFRLWAALLLYVVSIPLHEALHWCGFVLANGVARRDVEWRFDRKTLTPFTVCRTNTTVARYKVAAMLPLLCVGIPPLAYGLAAPDPTLFVVGLFTSTACASDLVLFFLLSRMSNRSVVARHPQRIGFVVAGSA